jgi:hypothetical protein
LQAHWDFLKQRNSPKHGDSFGYKFNTFSAKKMFKNMACILGLFDLATVLATFQKKILGNFFPNYLVTLVPGKLFTIVQQGRNNTKLGSASRLG